jgi:tetratricopeptide (TPR) repeat protein
MKRRFRILWYSTLLLWIVSGAPVSAQQNQLGRIIGSVHVLKGDFPEHPVLISLEMRGAPIASAYCDDQGRFGFYNLLANMYRVTINDDRYEPVSEQSDLNPDFSTTNMVNITLVLRPTAKKDPLPGRVGGSNPYLIDPAEYNRQFPKTTLKEFHKGVEADRKGKTDEAVQHYEKALSYSPTYYPAHNNLGSVYLARKNFGVAQAEFEAALKANQNDVEAYFNLGNVLLNTQHFSAAEEEIREGLQRQPDSAFGHFLQGSVYARTGRLELAEKSLRSAVEIDPNMSQAHLQLVNLYLQQKRTPKAVEELESYLKSFPDSPFSAKARELLKRLQSEAASTATRN